MPGLVLHLTIMFIGLGIVELEFRLGLGSEVMAMLAASNLRYALPLCLEFRVWVRAFMVGVMVYC